MNQDTLRVGEDVFPLTLLIPSAILEMSIGIPIRGGSTRRRIYVQDLLIERSYPTIRQG